MTIKNGGKGTKPVYNFMVIISILAIELKVTPNGNPTNDMYWEAKNLAILMLWNETPLVGLLFFTVKFYIA